MAKRVAIKENPRNSKSVRQRELPLELPDGRISWHFRLLDETHDSWGWKGLGRERWWNDVFPKLKNFETMTWEEIQRASGGRSAGNNSHFVPILELDKRAQDRLCELMRDDLDQLFSLRLSGTQRVWGVRKGTVLQIIWIDLHHEVCPCLR